MKNEYFIKKKEPLMVQCKACKKTWKPHKKTQERIYTKQWIRCRFCNRILEYGGDKSAKKRTNRNETKRI